jgi:site-specific DNA-methyltransferase (adenine-specific)
LPGKPDTQQARTERSKARAFAPSGERLIIAESPRSQSSVVAAEDKLRARVFRPVIDYLISEHSRSGVSASDIIKWHAARGLPKYSTARHVLSANSQWAFPTAEAYSHLRDCLNDLGDGSYLDREYEGLRREYEGLRRPFDIEQTSMWSDCWHFPPTPAQPGRHPCEKPLALMEHIIATTTRPTDVVLDAFCGSGSTGAACVGLGRQFIGIERDSRWVDYAQDRIDAAVAQQRLFA